MRRAGNENRPRERLVLLPHGSPVELDEQVVARRRGIVGRDEVRDPGAPLGLEHSPLERDGQLALPERS